MRLPSPLAYPCPHGPKAGNDPMRPALPRLLAAALLALPLAAAAQPACAQKSQRAAEATQPASPRPANIDRNGVVILVKSALLALDHANKTGNYTVLRDLGSINFQANSAARLAEIFASQRAQKLDLAGIIVLDPQLSLLPQIEPNGMLHIAGFFPSAPTQVNFEMLWEPVNREWRLYGMSVNLSTGGPQAPDAPPPAPPSASAEPAQAPTASVTSAPVPEPRPQN